MRLQSFTAFSSIVVTSLALLAAGCNGAPSSDVGTTSEELSGPGAGATDQRRPELGGDLTLLRRSKISLAHGVAQAEGDNGPVIEAKFELDDNHNLSLSLYPAGKSLDFDSERNVFQELSGDPTASPFTGGLEVFADQEHLTRSSRDLTLRQLSRRSVADAIHAGERYGTVYWTIPTIRHGRAGYGVYYTPDGHKQRWMFVDGAGSDECTGDDPEDLGAGPGRAATDARVPELGDDLSILKQSKTSLAAGVAQVERESGPVVEAKFELGDDKKLSLSIYPVGKGLRTDAERNTFFEASGDPTASAFAPNVVEFKAPDAAHLTRSARDLTLAQTASLGLRDAIEVAQSAMPDGVVFWAIPTIRETRAGYGVYVYGTDGKAHYFFIS